MSEMDPRAVIAEKIVFLAEFKQNLRRWFSGAFTPEEGEELRSTISRAVHRARQIVMDTGCMKVFGISPPPMIGGPIFENIDPFADVFQHIYGVSVIPTLMDAVEEAIGVLQSLEYLEREAREGQAASPDVVDLARTLQRVLHLCSRFDRIVRQLQQRHDSRDTITIEDEYDVQDLFHALLQLDFDDVRPEEPSPSQAGKSARVDFLLKREKIVIEIKKTRKGLGAREVGDQLIIDIRRYRAHPDCHALVCFVYDPERRIGNPAGLSSDLTEYCDGLDVRVVIHP
jgi:hypothetical protein